MEQDKIGNEYEFQCRQDETAIIEDTTRFKALRICSGENIIMGNICKKDAITCEMHRMSPEKFEEVANKFGIEKEILKAKFKGAMFG